MIKHSFFYFISKLLPAIVSIIAISVYTRYLEPEVYGLFSLLSVIVGIINIFVFQWTRSGLIRFYNERENKGMLQSEIIYWHMILLFFLFLSTIFFVNLMSQTAFSEKLVFLSFLMLVSLVLKELFIVFFRTLIKPKVVSLFTVITSIVVFLISYILIANDFGLMGLLLGNSLGSILVLVIFIKYLNKHFTVYKLKKLSLVNSKTLFRYGAPITFSFGLSVLMQNADKIMISRILGLKENGNYAIAYDLTHNTIYMVLTSISLAAFPLVLKKLGTDGLKHAIKEFHNYIHMFLFIAFPLTAGFISISSNFINIVVDNTYEINEKLLILIILSALFHSIKSFWFDQILQISGETKYFFIPAFVALVINVILNSFLLRVYGIDGAAIATLISFFVSMIISFLYSRQYFIIKISLMDFSKLFVNTILMFLLISQLFLESELLLLLTKVIMGVLVYAFMSLLTNPFNIRKKILSLISV